MVTWQLYCVFSLSLLVKLTADVELAADPEGDGEGGVGHLAHDLLHVVGPVRLEDQPGPRHQLAVS